MITWVLEPLHLSSFFPSLHPNDNHSSSSSSTSIDPLRESRQHYPAMTGPQTSSDRSATEQAAHQDSAACISLVSLPPNTEEQMIVAPENDLLSTSSLPNLSATRATSAPTSKSDQNEEHPANSAAFPDAISDEVTTSSKADMCRQSQPCKTRSSHAFLDCRLK